MMEKGVVSTAILAASDEAMGMADMNDVQRTTRCLYDARRSLRPMVNACDWNDADRCIVADDVDGLDDLTQDLCDVASRAWWSR